MQDEYITDIKHILIASLFPNLSPEDIGDDDDLIERFDLDSFTVLELILGLEEHFEISLESIQIDLDMLRTPRRISKLVAQVIQTPRS